MLFLANLAKSLVRLTKSLADFLFPSSTRVLRLENLSPSALFELLPKVQVENNPDIVALFDYAHPLVKEVIWEVKYHGNTQLAQTLGVILFDVIEAELAERNVLMKEKSVILMPVPMADKRRFERGWNQTELLAEALKKVDRANYLKYLPRQLIKIRHTESQTRTATRRERLENLKGSMLVQNPLSVENRFVVLLDDVVTTGATFTEAKRSLKEAGAKKILCIAIAH